MIHFDFILDDDDAETLIDAVAEIKREARERLLGVEYQPMIIECPNEEKEWWKKRAEYGEQLLKLMHHKRIEGGS